MSSSKKRVLITGAAGFLGSHLCDKFLEEGHEVIGMDNLITGNLANLDHLTGIKDFSFYEYDITNFVHIPGKLDYILHFASPASPVDYLKIPIQTLKAGSLGTYKLLGLAKEKNARILIASTSEVYGNPLEHPQKETYYGNVDTIGPRSVYDEAKRFMEALTMAYNRFHKVDTAIVRIFNTYGPRMRLNDGRVIPTFIRQILDNKPLTIFGDGQQTRSFCYVNDLIDGVYKVLLSHHKYPINIGNPEEISIIQLAEELCHLAGIKVKMKKKPLPVGDPLRREPDISKAKKILDWHPKITRKDGLQKTITFFKTLPKERKLHVEPKTFEHFIQR